MFNEERRQIRAAAYVRLVQDADALVEASPLEHVRRKHEVAAARWRALAALDQAAGV